MKRIFLLYILLAVHFIGYSQHTDIVNSGEGTYQNALDLYQKSQYSAAIAEFEKAQEVIRDKNSEIFVNSAYYKAVCALNLFNRNAAHLFKEFMRNYPESPRIAEARFQLGKYYYRKKDWEKVLEQYGNIDIFELNLEQQHEYRFRKGYTLYQVNEKDQAKKQLSEIIEVSNAFYEPANYYYAQIAYEQGNYRTAFNGFKKIEESEKFSKIVPYYLTQIYFLEKKYEELVTYASPFIEERSTKRKSEIAKLLGEAHFALNNFDDAVTYLELHLSQPGTGNRNDYFQLGFAHKQNGDCTHAVKFLQRVTYENDSLAQAANYLQAECQLKLGAKPSAISSFRNAARTNFNPEIQEDALFSFALLSYETDYDPYNNAINAFIEYLEKFESGYRKDQVFEYLVDIYINTRNYGSALASLETSMQLDSRLKKVYQQLLFNQATEKFLNADYVNAANTYKKSRETPVERELATRALFWRAEALYREKRFKAAAREFETFIYEPGAILLDEFSLAHYNIGYAFFQQKDYKNAASWFRKFANDKDADSTKVNDALIRTGDAYFITKNYLLSLEFYEKALDYDLMDSDYVLYQLAMAQGVLNNRAEKNELLQKLVSEYPESSHYPAAIFELGRSRMIEGENEKALAVFEEIITNHAASPYKRRAQVSKGLIFYNQNQNEKALQLFKQVVDENPTYTDSREALRAIRNIYVEAGKIDEYETYMTNLGFINVTRGSIDSLKYESAEMQYLSGNTNKTIQAFTEYLNEFENPLFALNARFYLAETLLRAGKADSAKPHFEYVADKPLNKFSEEAVRRAADMNYKHEEYIKALRYYQRLAEIAQSKDNKQSAAVGTMNAAFRLEKTTTAYDAAQTVLEFSKISKSNRIEALFVQAKSLDAEGDTAAALKAYTVVTDTTNNRRAAASKYRIAEILYLQNKLDTAKKAVFSLINHDPAYEYFLAKGLLLLSDIFVAQDDAFQAKATLQSIIDNYTGDDDILALSREKMDEIIERENPSPKEQEEEIIDLGDDDNYYDQLLPEEEIDEDEETEKLIDNE